MYRAHYEHYITLLRSRLSQKRFVHSMNVAKEAVRLARLYGADEEKAYVAGLLHDIMKEEKPELQLQMIKESDIMTDMVTLHNRPLWHAKAGAAYCRTVLHIQDDDIINAISFHTTARADMSLLEKVLYLADYIGEDRDYEDVDVMRKEALTSVKRGMLYALIYTIQDLSNRNKAIHLDTVQAYNQLVLSGKE